MNIESMQDPKSSDNAAHTPANRNYLFMGLASLLAVTAIMYVDPKGCTSRPSYPLS